MLNEACFYFENNIYTIFIPKTAYLSATESKLLRKTVFMSWINNSASNKTSYNLLQDMIFWGDVSFCQITQSCHFKLSQDDFWHLHEPFGIDFLQVNQWLKLFCKATHVLRYSVLSSWCQYTEFH